jgi:hypothetical protein
MRQKRIFSPRVARHNIRIGDCRKILMTARRLADLRDAGASPAGSRAARCGRYALGVICAGELHPGLASLRAGMLISGG